MKSNVFLSALILLSFLMCFTGSDAHGAWVELTNDDFESGWGNYSDGGNDCGRYTGGTYAHQGSDAAYIRDNSSPPSSTFFHTDGIDVDTNNCTEVKVEFWFYSVNFSNGEDFYVDFYDGSTWQEVARYIRGTDFENGGFYFETINILETSYTFPTDMKIRFRCSASNNFDYVYIDEIVVSGDMPPDTFPPIPNPAAFLSAPTATSDTVITMTAFTGSDPCGPVEYFFDETTGNTGGTDSPWQTNSNYTDTGLIANTTYTYTVQMRDNIPNTGTASGGQSATTHIVVPDVINQIQATAEVNIIAAGFTIGATTTSPSDTIQKGKVMSQNPAGSSTAPGGSAIDIVISLGTAMIDMEDLLVFVQNWMTTACGTCNGQDYTGDNKVTLDDFVWFGLEWLEDPMTVVINEFMASNNTTIQDPDEAGEYPDWIELYNYGDNQIELSGLYLNDRTHSWQIPPGVFINSGEYKLFWADDDEEQGPTHTEYGLGAGGDEIVLLKNGEVVDSIDFKNQVTDISFGRFTDGQETWYLMNNPTPGATNTAGMASDVYFSRLSGTFTSDFSLTLSASLGATIYYTTNGTLPNGSSAEYSTPLLIQFSSGTQRVRARAYEAGMADGRPISHYYTALNADVQGFTSTLPIIVIDTYSTIMDPTYRMVSSVFIDVDKDTGIADIQDLPDYAGRGGMKRRGESSYWYAKAHYALELRDDYDEDEKHSLVGMASESDWILNNPYSDKTLMRNVLAYKWANDIMEGYAAPKTKFVEVFVNEGGGNCSSSDYRGIYVLTEKIKVSKNRVDIGSLDSGDSTEPDVTGGYILRLDKDNGQEFFNTSANMITNKDNPGDGPQYFDPDGFTLTPTQKTWIQDHLDEFETVLLGGSFADPVNGYAKYIDVENFMEYDIMNEIQKNCDGFGYSAYFYKKRNGNLSWGPLWDYNLATGNTNQATWWFPEWFAKTTTVDEGWFNDGFPGYGWHARLLQDPEYMLGTADKWFEHREDKLSDAQITADIDNIHDLLDSDGPIIAGNTPVDRNFAQFDILNSYVDTNYYFGYNVQEQMCSWYPDYVWHCWSIDPADREQQNLPHTYHMETEWLKNWFNGEGIPDPCEWYPDEYSDRMGKLDAFWASDRNIVAPPTLLINGSPMDTGGHASVGASLTITKTTSGTIYYTDDGTDPRQPVTGNAVGTTYSGAITLNSSKQIKARIKNGSYWSALNKANFAIGPVAGNLRITELMYHPVDPNDEFIELKNIGASSIDLAWCKFTDGIKYTFPSWPLAAGDYALVVRNQPEFIKHYPAVASKVVGEYTGYALSNGGEEIVLRDAARTEIHDFDYNDWYPVTDGHNFSLCIIDPASTDPNDWDEKQGWQASSANGGSPGAANPANVQPNGAIVINEVLTHTDDLIDGDWIELYNTTGSPIDVGGWFLSDDIDDLKKYEIASGTLVPAGGYKVFTAVANFRNISDPGSYVQFGLSELGEEVFLSSGSGAYGGVLTGGFSITENFGASENDVTFGRYIKTASAAYDHNLGALASNNVGYWKMDDNAANTIVFDDSGNANDGVAAQNTDVLSTTGLIDGALTFNGTSDYIDVGEVIGTGSYTKVAWIKRADAAASNNIISSGTAATHAFFAPSGQSFKLSSGHNTDFKMVQDPVPLNPDTWYHVAVTFDAGAGIMTLYKNGIEVDQATSVPTQNPSTTTYIGRFDTGFYFNGSIDNAMVFDKALTENEIQQLYAKIVPDDDVDFVTLVTATKENLNSAAKVDSVVINEIMYNSSAVQDQLGEFIELKNRSGSPVTLYDTVNPLNTWKFTKGIDYTFPVGISIPANDYLLVVRTDPDIFKLVYSVPGGVQVLGPFASFTELQNNGEKIELSKPTNPEPGGFVPYVRLEQVNYSDGSHPVGDDPWPVDADGYGDSLNRKVDGDYGNDIDNWQAAVPTPGAANASP